MLDTMHERRIAAIHRPLPQGRQGNRFRLPDETEVADALALVKIDQLAKIRC